MVLVVVFAMAERWWESLKVSGRAPFETRATPKWECNCIVALDLAEFSVTESVFISKTEMTFLVFTDFKSDQKP